MTRKELPLHLLISVWVGVRVRELRKRRGLTLAQLAQRCGSFRPIISRIEQGTHQPSLDTLYRLARALDVRPVELLTREDWDAIDAAARRTLRTRERAA